MEQAFSLGRHLALEHRAGVVQQSQRLVELESKVPISDHFGKTEWDEIPFPRSVTGTTIATSCE